ncbi:MAG: flavin reductase, partial [Acidiferrobacterales bacterium]
MTRSIFDELHREVYLVSSSYHSVKAGMIVTWITPASLIPERQRVILVLSPEQHTTKTLINSQKFIIHLLAKHQIDLVPIFGLYTSKDYDKFASVNFKESAWSPAPLEASDPAMVIATGVMVGPPSEPRRNPIHIALHSDM